MFAGAQTSAESGNQGIGGITLGRRLSPKPPRFEGWLVLPAAGLLLSPFRCIYELWISVQLLRVPMARSIADGIPGAGTAMVAETALLAAYTCLLIYVAVLFFRKKRAAPKAFVVLMLARLAHTAIVEVVIGGVVDLPPDGAALLRSAVLCAIWIPYFCLSKRVKRTFVVD